jgi:putative transposase
MANHYHLLIRTPKANASVAVQWLNQSYGMWWNRRHGRSGHVFQGRFKGVLVEGGGWILALSFYLHFNPVAVKNLGWGKEKKKAESLGLVKPTADIVNQRLGTLRKHRWSSYGSYAGYEKIPAWLSVSDVLSRVKGGRDGYRKKAEAQLTQDVEENVWSKLKWGAVLGSEKFAEGIRKRVKVMRETPAKRELSRKTNWDAIVEAIEKVKGEPWVQFRDRHGDWGRDMAFWIARRRGGMTLKELAKKAGEIDYAAVSEAVRHFERHKRMKSNVQRAYKNVIDFLNIEM